MNQPLSYIEVIFTPHARGFKATTPSFPKCKGIGKTREEATEKLGKSIAFSFSKTVFEGLNDIFTTEDFTDVLDPNGPKGQEKRVFPLLGPSKGRRLSMELPPISELAKMPSFKKSEKDINNLNEIVALSAISEMIQDFAEEFSANEKPPFPTLSDKSESIIFGFPLNFN